MTALLARILLAMVMFPLGILMFIVVGAPAAGWFGPTTGFLLGDLASAAFVGAYWTWLWWGMVRWTTYRVVATLVAGLASVVIAGLIILFIGRIIGAMPPGIVLGGCTAITVWLAATIPIWRESAVERAERLRHSSPDVVTCPVCGYNLTGLSDCRCPECGNRFTLDQLLKAQRHEVL